MLITSPPCCEPTCRCAPCCVECGHLQSAHDDMHRCRQCVSDGLTADCAFDGVAPEYALPDLVSAWEHDTPYCRAAIVGDVCETCGYTR